jgi:phospholipase/carboxylesterase
VPPFERPPTPSLQGTDVLLLLGRNDPYLPAGRALPARLEAAGATVEADELEAGHDLTREDVARLAAWFAALET